MDSVVNTDALLYVVIAKTLMAIVFLVVASVAIWFGAKLFRRGFELSSNDKLFSDQDINVKRLARDTWLPKGTLVKTKEKTDEDRFTKLEKDSWLPTGTLVRTPAKDLETQLKLQITGSLLMLSSLFWGWLSYLTSPLDVQSLNTQLAGTHEHRIRNLLGNLQGEINTLLINIRDLKQASDSNVKTDTLQTGLNQIGNVLTTQLSALQQEMGVVKSEMIAVKTQPQQLQQTLFDLSAQIKQLPTEQTTAIQQSLDGIKNSLENNQTTTLQQTQQLITTLSNQLQTSIGQLQQTIQPPNLTAKLESVTHDLAQIKQAVDKPIIDNNLSTTLQTIQQELQSLKIPNNPDLPILIEHFNGLKTEIATLQSDLETLKTTVKESNDHHQLVAASLLKTDQEIAKLPFLTQEIQAVKNMFIDFNKQNGFAEIKAEVSKLRNELESKQNSVLVPQKIEEINNNILKALLAPETPKLENWGAYIDINFPFPAGKDEPSDVILLTQLGEALKSPPLKGKEILLQGYSDNRGNAEKNQDISQKRADYIKRYLVEHYGLDATSIQTEGKGENDPIASNKTVEGRAQNRRIRVSVR
ncbi:MAG: hypothetical protein RIT27_356 [Pseudomonadota bacterium]|jgi:outer membrane protein OmpA-like peptidoglycan-associated protein